jgi:hypothetical protein
VLYAPEPVRPALFALHGIDLEMASVVVGTTEPMIGEIRLAWWREALQGLDEGRVPAQPLLALVAAELLRRGIKGADLAEIEDRWLGPHAGVERGARPVPVPWIRDDPCGNGILLDVAQGIQAVLRIHDYREESALPIVARRAAPRVEPCGEFSMPVAYPRAQRRFGR